MNCKYFFILFILFFSIGYSSPVGSPAQSNLLDKGFFLPFNWPVHFKGGYEGNFLLNGRMNQVEESSGRVDGFSLQMNSGTFTFNLDHRYEICGVFGSGLMKSDWRFNTGTGDSKAKVETRHGFSWAIAGNTLVYPWADSYIGIGLRITGSKANLSWLTINGVNIPSGGANFRFLQWQGSGSIGHQIGYFIPYIGLKYCNTRGRIQNIENVAIANNGQGKIHMQNRNKIGFFLGVTLTKKEYFLLNIEGRLVDEEAVSISGDLQF